VKPRPNAAPAIAYAFGLDDLKALLESREGPCVSVYFPAHRRKTEARSDSILYRNLCREVEKILLRDTSAPITQEIAARLRGIDEPEFWERGSDGVAVFASPDFFACYRLPMALPTLHVIGGTFHMKPMLRYLQGGLSYHVLALSLHRAVLYEGWGDGLQEVPAHGMPASIEDVSGADGTPEARGPHPRGGDRANQAHGGGGEQGKAEIEKYFREVARVLQKNGLKSPKKPLILAAQGHHQPLFRKVAQLSNLIDEGIVVDAAKLTPEAICAEARRLLQPRFEQRIRAAVEEYGLAASRGQGSDKLPEISARVAQGRVKQLFVESGRRFWGLLDRSSGEILPGEPVKNAYDVDLYDELAELTLARGGDVLVLSSEQMPAKTGIAATYRY
jgi:hypothetical protein